MSDQNHQQSATPRVKVLPCIAGLPFPSALLIVAGLLNGPLLAIAALLVHIVFKRPLYGEYRRLPYPMPTGTRLMDEVNGLLVKGLPESFFQQLDAAGNSGASVQITCPKKHRMLQMSLSRYASRVGCYPQFQEGDEITLAVTEHRPGRAGAGRSLPSIQELREPADDRLVQEDSESPVEIKKDKRKVILD